MERLYPARLVDAGTSTTANLWQGLKPRVFQTWVIVSAVLSLLGCRRASSRLPRSPTLSPSPFQIPLCRFRHQANQHVASQLDIHGLWPWRLKLSRVTHVSGLVFFLFAIHSIPCGRRPVASGRSEGGFVSSVESRRRIPGQ